MEGEAGEKRMDQRNEETEGQAKKVNLGNQKRGGNQERKS